MDEYINKALELATKTLFLSNPNPRVGCVLVNDNKIIGEGFTQETGKEHAEIMALKDVQNKGLKTQGATAFVTLEPCCHIGKTGSCCNALINAGISKVIASIEDPNPLVAGKGFKILREAGIEVEIGLGAKESQELNLGFFSRFIRKKPWVRIKIASSLDGTTALSNGKSQWITGEKARIDNHYWRARSCVIMTGTGTILKDNPQLNVRYIETKRQPKIAIIDSQLKTPKKSKILKNKCLIYTIQSQNNFKEHKNIEVISLNKENIDLKAVMDDLVKKEINEIHVEAGFNLNGALLRTGLVDELLIYIAPKLLGNGLGLAKLGEFIGLNQGIEFSFHEVTQIGEDLRILARVKN